MEQRTLIFLLHERYSKQKAQDVYKRQTIPTLLIASISLVTVGTKFKIFLAKIVFSTASLPPDNIGIIIKTNPK